MFPEIHYCPICEGAVGANFHAEITAPGYPYVVTRLHCDFCRRGWEAVWRRHGAGRRLIAQVCYAADTNPEDYGKFCQRLESGQINRGLVRATLRDLKKVAVV